MLTNECWRDSTPLMICPGMANLLPRRAARWTLQLLSTVSLSTGCIKSSQYGISTSVPQITHSEGSWHVAYDLVQEMSCDIPRVHRAALFNLREDNRKVWIPGGQDRLCCVRGWLPHCGTQNPIHAPNSWPWLSKPSFHLFLGPALMASFLALQGTPLAASTLAVPSVWIILPIHHRIIQISAWLSSLWRGLSWSTSLKKPSTPFLSQNPTLILCRTLITFWYLSTSDSMLNSLAQLVITVNITFNIKMGNQAKHPGLTVLETVWLQGPFLSLCLSHMLNATPNSTDHLQT